MTSPKKSKNYQRFQYSIDSLEDAVEQVRSKQMSFGKAARLFKIPKSTLFHYVRNKSSVQRKMGPAAILSDSEELKLKTWILAKARIGFPMHPEEVKLAVQKVIEKIGRPNPFKNNKPGRKWMDLFLKRNPEIVSKNTEIISKARAAVTEEGIRAWFSVVSNYLKEENAEEVLNEPSRIYNLDEIGMNLCPKTGKLLGERGENNNYTVASGSEKESITVLCCYAASGESIDPLIVYPYQRLPRDIMAGVPSNVAVGRSPSGWMISATFYEYMANVFYKRLVERSITFPVVLFMDGHKSHTSLELHDFCVEKQILLVCLPPNATHIIQPCDVGIFRPLKIEWRKIVQEHKQSTTKTITKINFAPLFFSAYSKVKNSTVIKAFESCGIFPFNPNSINYTKCISTRHTNLSELNGVDDSEDENRAMKQLLDIEAEIPPNIQEMFLKAYEMQQEPSTEKILFSIWKKFKNELSKLQETGNEIDPNLQAADAMETDQLTSTNFTTELPAVDMNYCENVNQQNLTEAANINTSACDDSGFCSASSSSDAFNIDSILNMPVDIVNFDNSMITLSMDELDYFMQVGEEISIPSCIPIIDVTAINNNSINSVISVEVVADEMQCVKTNHSNTDDPNTNNDDTNKNASSVLNMSHDGQTGTQDINKNGFPVLEYSNSRGFSVTKDSRTESNQRFDGSEGCSIESPTLALKKQDNFEVPSTNQCLDLLEERLDLNKFKDNPVLQEISKHDSNKQNKTSAIVNISETENVNKIWQDHLHYPRIETANKKRKKTETIYAVTSQEWKERENTKRQKAENEKLEKEQKREERLLKRQIKQEEIENKKANKTKKSDQKLNKKVKRDCKGENDKKNANEKTIKKKVAKTRKNIKKEKLNE